MAIVTDATYAVQDGTVTITHDSTDPTGAQSQNFTPTPGSPTANRDTLFARATTALTNNATFLALASPTQAQTAAQVAALTRQVDAVIRLLIGQLDTISNT